MRLALIGPAGSHADAVGRIARFLLEELVVERAVYLGTDSALDDAIAEWAAELVGPEPTDEKIWVRAAERCARAEAPDIDAFVGAERERARLLIFESLPDGARAIEIIGGKVAVMIHDKAGLDEEDILAATLLVFGRSSEPVVKQVGSRWFLSPGPLSDGGILVLDDKGAALGLSLYDKDLQELRQEEIVLTRAAHLRVADAG